jgi:hypothetical protein
MKKSTLKSYAAFFGFSANGILSDYVKAVKPYIKTCKNFPDCDNKFTHRGKYCQECYDKQEMKK